MTDDRMHCDGTRTPVSLRKLLICATCDRSHYPGRDMQPEAYHDGKVWTCEARVVDGQRAPVFVGPAASNPKE